MTRQSFRSSMKKAIKATLEKTAVGRSALNRYLVFRTSQAAKQSTVDLQAQLEQSERGLESVGQWWNRCHSENEEFGYWLTGSSGSQVWTSLNVEDRIGPGTTVLNIGVGQGHCTRGLVELGCRVHALDISPVALKRISDCVIAVWLPSQLHDLHSDTFDLAISHLVAQHMSDADLNQQIREVVRSLKADGVFAMQFAFCLSGNDKDIEETPGALKAGSIRRSLETVKSMITNAGGRLVWSTKIAEFPEHNAGWYAVNIQRQVES